MPKVQIDLAVAALTAIARAIKQLPEPEMRGALILSILWTLAGFVILWLLVSWSIAHWTAGNRYLDWGLSLLGALAAPVISTLLLPFVATAILGIYSERIILAVERRYYPDLPPPPPTRWGDQIRSVLRLMGASVVLTLLALPLYLLVPGANLVLFLALNGYLLGRGYFELVMLRRLDWTGTRQLWPQFRLSFLIVGAVVAVIFSIPLANLLAPIIGTAVAVHLTSRKLATSA